MRDNSIFWSLLPFSSGIQRFFSVKTEAIWRNAFSPALFRYVNVWLLTLLFSLICVNLYDWICLSMCFSVISVGKKSRFIIEVEMNCQETTVTFAHEAWHYFPKEIWYMLNSSTTLLWVPFWNQMWLGVSVDMAMHMAPETKFYYNNQRLFRC